MHARIHVPGSSPPPPTPHTQCSQACKRTTPCPAETARIPIEDTAYASLFARHPIWRRVMGKAGRAVLEKEAFRANAWRQAQGTEGGDLRQLARYYNTLGL